MASWTRRLFLFSGVAAGGALVVGAGGLAWFGSQERVATQRAALPDDGRGPLVGLWLRVNSDSTVTVLSPHTEMGQGTQTGLAQIVADELDVPWASMAVELAPATTAFANGAIAAGFIMGDKLPTGFVGALVRNTFWTIGDLMNLQITGGSTSIRFTGWKSLRSAAAAAREVLLQAGADAMGVGRDQVNSELGYVVGPNGEKLSYGELAAAAALLPLDPEPPFKPRSAWRYIGQPMPRLDIPSKVYATATYGIDVDLPGMRYAAVQLTPVIGAEVTEITNEAEILTRRGVHSVHIVPRGVAVVADNPWRAEQAVRAVTFEHEALPHAQESTASLYAKMRADLDDPGHLTEVMSHGDFGSEQDGEFTMEAEYEVPFLAHTPMEPMNATVTTEDGRLTVYVGVQNPLGARANLAAFLDEDPESIVVKGHTMGGGFGRRACVIPGDQDHIDAAAQLHRAVGGPIKLLWSREADVQGCYMRNGTVARLLVKGRPDGTIAAWDQRTWGVIQNPTEASPHGYQIPAMRVSNVEEASFIPFNYWRSVDASIYPFFIESMVDEVARAAGVDPLQARLAMLPDGSRQARVLRAAAKMAGWRTGPDADGKALGIAVVTSFGSVVAQVAEVSMEADRPRVHRVWVAADVGTAVNPDSVTAQMEGGVQFALTAALYGRIDIEKGGVKQSNFHDYKMVRLGDSADVIVQLLDSPDSPVGGAGEPGVPPLAPAVANAMAVLGPRPRALPLTG